MAHTPETGTPLIDMRGMYEGDAVRDHFSYWRP